MQYPILLPFSWVASSPSCHIKCLLSQNQCIPLERALDSWSRLHCQPTMWLCRINYHDSQKCSLFYFFAESLWRSVLCLVLYVLYLHSFRDLVSPVTSLRAPKLLDTDQESHPHKLRDREKEREREREHWSFLCFLCSSAFASGPILSYSASPSCSQAGCFNTKGS
jgi:hypothetical protein